VSIIKMPAPLVVLTTFILFAPALAQAQDKRFRVSLAPAVATVGGDAESALGGTFGYRFSEHFWFEGDLTWIDAATGGFGDRDFEFDDRVANASDLADLVRRLAGMFGGRLPGGIGLPSLPNFPNGPIDIGRLGASTDGSTMVVTLGIRYELPVQTERFRPYVAGGLGINHTDQEFKLDATAFTPAIDASVSHTGYAFNAGAGASVRLASQFWADVDARYFRLSRDHDVMRLGGGVSFRF
jgi:opacity protein-like surface antigen